MRHLCNILKGTFVVVIESDRKLHNLSIRGFTLTKFRGHEKAQHWSYYLLSEPGLLVS